MNPVDIQFESSLTMGEAQQLKIALDAALEAMSYYAPMSTEEMTVIAALRINAEVARADAFRRSESEKKTQVAEPVEYKSPSKINKRSK